MILIDPGYQPAPALPVLQHVKPVFYSSEALAEEFLRIS